jgi:hypothetical protein
MGFMTAVPLLRLQLRLLRMTTPQVGSTSAAAMAMTMTMTFASISASLPASLTYLLGRAMMMTTTSMVTLAR